MQNRGRESRLKLETSDRRLQESFEWAKSQALSYVFDGDPVGKWYEASLPAREAFCMRDVAHHATGAQLLGLSEHTRNMLHKFATNISPYRDWCSYWEINRWDAPAPVDYKDDQDFWYNIPANFDVIDCCWRMYLWTGDKSYLEDERFNFFYSKSLSEYVEAWDRDGDGIMEHYPEYGRRGIASYIEENLGNSDILTGADLIASQYAAYKAYALILNEQGDAEGAANYYSKAIELQRLFHEQWINPVNGKYYVAKFQDHSQSDEWNNVMVGYFGIATNDDALGKLLDDITYWSYFDTVPLIEMMSYTPEVLYKYGRHEDAYSFLIRISDPSMKRRIYPEVSFAWIGCLAEGLMGIAPDTRMRAVKTCSRLTARTPAAKLSNIPMFEGEVHIQHVGKEISIFSNDTGRPVIWNAVFPGRYETLYTDGQEIEARIYRDADGLTYSSVELVVEDRALRRAEVHL